MNASQSICRCHPQVLSQLGCQCRYMTPAEAVEDAMRRVCEAQLRVIERLTAELAQLRRELGR